MMIKVGPHAVEAGLLDFGIAGHRSCHCRKSVAMSTMTPEYSLFIE
jgi:hypothetical protein